MRAAKSYSFVLMEIMIGVVICAFTIGWLSSSNSRLLKNQLMSSQKIDAQRQSALAFFSCIQSIKNFDDPVVDQNAASIKASKIRPGKPESKRHEWRKITCAVDKKVTYKLLIHRLDPNRQKIDNR